MDCRYPIIDSHVHFYDSTRPEGTTWPPCEHGYPVKAMPDDLFESTLPLALAGVVLVETGNRKPDDEWLMHVAEQEARILGVVANLQPGEEGFGQRLEGFSQYPKLKGIRLRPIKQYDLTCSRLTAHLDLLSGYGLSLELGATTHGKLLEFVSLARKLPETWCGLTHLGHPKISGEAPAKEWSRLIGAFAELPNTFCKFTALSEFSDQIPAPRDAQYYRPVVSFLLEAFSADRVIYGSNWPGDSAAGDYAGNVRLYRHILTHDDSVLENLLYRNARTIYRL